MLRSVLFYMNTLMDQSQGILEDALEKGHNSLALKAISQIRNNLELVARIQAAIAQQQDAITIEVKDREDQQQRSEEEVKKILSPLERSVYNKLALKLIIEDPELKVDGIDYNLEGKKLTDIE